MINLQRKKIKNEIFSYINETEEKICCEETSMENSLLEIFYTLFKVNFLFILYKFQNKFGIYSYCPNEASQS